MAWIAPRTWVTSEVVTSTLFNTHVRDNLNALDHPILMDTAAIDVTNTVETSLLTAAPSIGAGSLGSNGLLKVFARGTYVKNVATSGMQLRLSLGGTDLILLSLELSSAGGTFKWDIEAEIANMASASVQDITFLIKGTASSAVTVTLTTGTGGATVSGGMLNGYFRGTGAVNTGSAQTLDLKAKWNTSPTVSWKREIAAIYQAAR
jgi:hypothetical protein